MDPLPGQVKCPSCGNNYIPTWTTNSLASPRYDRSEQVSVGAVNTSICSVCAEPEIRLDYAYRHPRDGDVHEASWTAYPTEDHAIDVVVHLIVDVQIRMYRSEEGEDMPADEVEEVRSRARKVFDRMRDFASGTDTNAVLKLANGVKDLFG